MISVIIPTYNRKKYLERCLESLLGQDYPGDKTEIIVVDDGSTDETKEITELLAQRGNIRYVRQEHQGVSAARNCGIREAHGSIISFVADDYIIPGDYCRRINEFFEEHPEANIIKFRVVNSGNNCLERASFLLYDFSIELKLYGVNLYSMSKNSYAAQFGKEIAVFKGSVSVDVSAFRKTVFEKFGIFDEKLRRGEDSEMGKRFFDKKEPVYYYPFIAIEHKWANRFIKQLVNKFKSGELFFYAKKLNPDQNMPFLANKNPFGNLVRNIKVYTQVSNVVARRSGKISEFLKCFPVIFLWEMAFCFGIFWFQLNHSKELA